MNIISDTHQRDTNTNRIAVNNEQKEDPNFTVKSNNEEPNDNNTTCTKYGGIVKMPDRFTYYIDSFIAYIYNYIIYVAYFVRRRGRLRV